MTTVEPCRCPAPNAECQRAGSPMVGRLWELCSGHCPAERPCAAGLSESYRSAWDHGPPTLPQKAVNLAAATGQHLAAGWRRVEPDVQAARIAKCETCPLFQAAARSCSHPDCGCQMDVKSWWAEQRCPIGNWEADVASP